MTCKDPIFSKDRILQLSMQVIIRKVIILSDNYLFLPTSTHLFQAPDTQKLTISGKKEVVYEHLVVNISNY